MAGVQYRRLAPANYADGRARPVAPAAPDRYVSNRIFNDGAQNLFSENGVSQWGFAWGQFMDHTFGLRATAGGESQPLPFDRRDEPACCCRTASCLVEAREAIPAQPHPPT
jgi:Animal haem peroxidase